MIRRLLALTSLVLIAACTEPAGMEPSEQAGSPDREKLSAAVLRDIAALRAATARFHRIDVADDAGWNVQFPPGCFDSNDPAIGAMGRHYINGDKVGSLSVTEPQLLIYERQKNGDSHLVGVEYIYPGLATDTPPRLFGRNFAYNDVFQVWVLHVWAWRHNPRGIFQDWNPAVTCMYDGDSAGSHH
jgi:hypothetical protein